MPQPIQPVQTLIQRYESLPPFAKVVLELCSVIYEAVDVSTLIRCLYLCEVDSETNRQNYAREIQPCLDLLQKKRLINARLECDRDIIETVTRSAIDSQHFHSMAEAVRTELPTEDSTLTHAIPSSRAIRDLRIALYIPDIEAFHHVLLRNHRTLAKSPHPLVPICNRPFAPQWFSTLPDHIQFLALHEIIKTASCRLDPIDQHLKYLEYGCLAGGSPPIERHDSFLYLLISGKLLQGDIAPAETLIRERQSRLATYGFSGWLHCLKGDYQSAISHFENDLTQLKSLNGNEQAYFTGVEGLLFYVCLLRAEASDYGRLRGIAASINTLQAGSIYQFAYEILAAVATARESKKDFLSFGPKDYGPEPSAIDALFLALANFWVEGRLDSELQLTLTRYYTLAINNGYRWLARELAELLYSTTRQPLYWDTIQAFINETATASLLDAITHEEPWRKAIRELDKIASQPETMDQARRERLIWLVSVDQDGTLTDLVPREQKLNEAGLWGKGRHLTLKKLAAQDIPYLTDHDRQICLAIRADRDLLKGSSYSLDLDQAVMAIIGHPLIFREDNHTVPIDVIDKEPELHIHENGKTVQLCFLPFPRPGQHLISQFESTFRLAVYQITPIHRRIADIIGPHGLHIPIESKDEVQQMIGGVAAHLTVHSDINSPSARLKTVEADRTIYCHLVPVNNGFHFSMLVRPMKEGGQYLRPGQGSRTIISEVQGKRIQVSRNLMEEEQRALLAVESCPSLLRHEIDNWEWQINDVPDCLQLLSELQAMPHGIVVEWPKGERLRLRGGTISKSPLYLKIKQRRQWFEIDGQLHVDEDTLLNLGEVLELIRRGRSRFIPMSDGHFFALSQEMYQQLDQLGSVTWSDKEHLQFSPLAAPFVFDLTRSATQFETDAGWQELERRIKEAETHAPEIPSTLQTTLRPYQEKGFHWLSRLAHVGFGACLADEMGLGKTIQALTLILSQAQHGPVLVIAPTSVCFNWLDEIEKFAPTLKTTLFGGNERKKIVNKLTSFDVLVTSYGLLQQEHELLSEKPWQVVVLDEAQAIKNMTTKRSRAAMNLKSRFKMITTGTPLENNLGELWNLFNFINPGLLGSITQFNKRFAGPIEKDKDRDCQKQLRRLVSPFILRRLKSQVLDELPPRTEVNLKVVLSEEEAAFYESLRRSALAKLEASQTTGNRQIQILAEIMRLRRACCNPALVVPGIAIPSSKMAVFEETIDELLANRHKVLVFSQFVDHLTIIRNFLDDKGINYQYLDGSTPSRQRKARVDAFQSGQGDIFLISLKAGGLGLNLTAANYVIHMDPWWNPAVEDQASDRVHRIGQKLPVTIYRMITQGTIEEKIVALHRDKRELAENLLRGSEVTDKVTIDELLELLKKQQNSPDNP